MNKFVKLLDGSTRPSIESFAADVHHLWHGANFGLVDRRNLMRQVATELLSELGEEHEVKIGDDAVNQALMDRVFVLAGDPENMRRKLLADALYGALKIVTSASEPKDTMIAGAWVYGPLYVLSGVLIANEAKHKEPRKLMITATGAEAFRRKFAAKHGGKARGWKTALALEYKVAPSTLYRKRKST